MKRHFAGAYVQAVLELLIAGPLAYFGWRFFPQLFLHPSPSKHLDDFLAFAAMVITGTVTTVAAGITLLHGRMSHGVMRGARMGALIADVWMVLTGVAMWVIVRQRGGDWAFYGILGALFLIATGTILLVLSLIILRYVRRMRADSN